MKTFLYGALFCAICVVISEAGGGRGEGGGRGGGRGFGFGKKMMSFMKKCGEGEMNTEDAMKSGKECWQEMAPTTEATRRRRSPQAENEEEQSEGGKGGKRRGGKGRGRGGGKFKGMFKNRLCVMVCSWKKVGLLDDSGSFSESGTADFVNKVYPEANRANMTEQLKTCASENSSKFSMEDSCSGYVDFKKCMFKAHATACGMSMNFGGGGGKKGGNQNQPPPPQSEPEDEEEED